MGRATQDVRLINLRKNDSIAAVAKVSVEEEGDLDEMEVADGESGDVMKDSEAPENSSNEGETPSED